MNKIVDFPGRTRIEQQAADWLIRLDGDDDLTLDERAALKAWLDLDPAHREALRRLADLWDRMNLLTELAVPLGAAARETSRAGRSRRFAILATLAATVIASGTVSMIYLADRDETAASNGLYATAVGQQLPVRLRDGSVVTLNTDSQVRVDFTGESRDVVLLRGEAHFAVARDADRPFLVSAGFGRVRAVGTAFSVYLHDGSVDVTVTEGRVALEAVRPRRGSDATGPKAGSAAATPRTIRELGTLAAGEVATITSMDDGDSGPVEVLDKVAHIGEPTLSRRLSWTEGVLYFSGESLAEVVGEISRYTTVSIEFADPQVGNIRIGGRFPVGETDAMLDALQNTFGLHVDYLSDTRVLISVSKR